MLYDVKVEEIVEQKELEEGPEKEICEMIDFKYFKGRRLRARQTLYIERKDCRTSQDSGCGKFRKTYIFNHLVSYRNTREFTTKKYSQLQYHAGVGI